MSYLRWKESLLISYDEIRRMEMEEVDHANRHLMVLMFDREKEMQRMRKKMHTHIKHVWASLDRDLFVDEELYQWSKRVD